MNSVILKYAVDRFKKFLIHLRSRTLFSRLKSELELYKEKRKAAIRWRKIWKSSVGKFREIDCEIQQGVRMRLYRDSRLSLEIFKGNFENNERLFLNAFLRPGDIFIDIGANLGFFTLIAASITGETGQVYAFEPYSKVYQRLLTNIELNNFTNVSCYQLALSEQAGYKDMAVLPNGFDAWNSLSNISKNPFKAEKIRCVTCDDFVEKNQLVDRTTMVKIDVEGWETYILSGATKTLSRKDAPILQVEFSDATCKAGGTTSKELYSLLESLGYRMFIYDAISKKLVFDPLRDSYIYLNLIAVKNLDQVMSRIHMHNDK